MLQRPSWLPVDIAGRAIVEIATQPTPLKSVVYHVLNHDTTSTWDRILSGLKQAGVRFDTVSREEWLERVAKSDPDGSRNPTIKLLVRCLPIASPLRSTLIRMHRVSIAIASAKPTSGRPWSSPWKLQVRPHRASRRALL